MDAVPPLSHLSILTLAHPLLSPSPATTTTTKRNSSDSITSPPNPALIAADLAHYRDLFTKLRFSYVEQVTKERFLRAITSDPPAFASAGAAAALERKLAEDKRALKARKEEVAGLIRELEDQGQDLARRYGQVQFQQTRLRDLPAEIENWEGTVEHLRPVSRPEDSNPELNLPLPATTTLLAARREQAEALDGQVEALRAAVRERGGELLTLREGMASLQARKIRAVQEAQEARRRRGEMGELEERGRWLRGVEGRMRQMLEA